MDNILPLQEAAYTVYMPQCWIPHLSEAENRLFLNQPEADVAWEGMVRIAKQETQGLDNSNTHIHIRGTCTCKKCVGMLRRALGNRLECKRDTATGPLLMLFWEESSLHTSVSRGCACVQVVKLEMRLVLAVRAKMTIRCDWWYC